MVLKGPESCLSACKVKLEWKQNADGHKPRRQDSAPLSPGQKNAAASSRQPQALRKEATQLKSELETTEVPWKLWFGGVATQIWYGKWMLKLYSGMSLCRSHCCMMHMMLFQVTVSYLNDAHCTECSIF